jgi:hypothetical protein
VTATVRRLLWRAVRLADVCEIRTRCRFAEEATARPHKKSGLAQAALTAWRFTSGGRADRLAAEALDSLRSGAKDSISPEEPVVRHPGNSLLSSQKM